MSVVQSDSKVFLDHDTSTDLVRAKVLEALDAWAEEANAEYDPGDS